MLMKVVVENGVKKLVPLTADAGSGNPCGTVIAVYSNQVPYGYLPCNGVAFDTAQFPVLYALLGDNHTPDLRECTLKGIGESGRTVGAHVKAGGLAVGEFVDDRVQEHTHNAPYSGDATVGAGFYLTLCQTQNQDGFRDSLQNNTGRSGATTEVKAVGVNFCIKATSGINENQADNVLSALTPVDQVALNNLHSVTSNAVAQAIKTKFLYLQVDYPSGATVGAELQTILNTTYTNTEYEAGVGYLVFFVAGGRWFGAGYFVTFPSPDNKEAYGSAEIQGVTYHLKFISNAWTVS